MLMRPNIPYCTSLLSISLEPSDAVMNQTLCRQAHHHVEQFKSELVITSSPISHASSSRFPQSHPATAQTTQHDTHPHRLAAAPLPWVCTSHACHAMWHKLSRNPLLHLFLFAFHVACIHV